MRATQNRNTRLAFGAATASRLDESPQRSHTMSTPGVSAVLDALGALENVVAKQCVKSPDALTPDGITSYALALLNLRECADAARFDRLIKACDALAVTVSRLIDDKNCANSDNCEALARFVPHARAMIHLHASDVAPRVIPMPLPSLHPGN
jgi:DNA-binding Xre family transcriptional regulator